MISLHPGLPNTINSYIGPEACMIHKLLFFYFSLPHDIALLESDPTNNTQIAPDNAGQYVSSLNWGGLKQIGLVQV